MWHCSLYCFSLITEFLQQQMSVLSQWNCCIFGTEQSTYWHDRLRCVVVLSKLCGYSFSHCFVSEVSLCLLEVEITTHSMIELQFFTHDTILLHFLTFCEVPTKWNLFLIKQQLTVINCRKSHICCCLQLRSVTKTHSDWWQHFGICLHL